MPTVGTTHHVKLGTEYLLIRPNSFLKKAAPTFGARIATGDPDYNNLSIWQHWVQKCWVGGMGADEWVDDAMFKDGVGLDTTVHEKVTLSRTLKRGAGANWALGGATGIFGYKFITFKGKLYCLKMISDGVNDSKLYVYDPTAESWTSVTMPGSVFTAMSIETFDGKLFVGGKTATPNSRIHWTTDPTGGWTQVTNPAGLPTGAATLGVRSMKQYNQKMYCSYNNQVWRMKDDQTWDGNVVFYKASANSNSNYIAGMEVHLGFLYMLSQNGHLHRTDGNNTFDIWSWDGQTAGVSMRSYDGKLFVGTYEWTDTIDIGYGVLYQFTGSAVTELKRWGKPGKATSIGQMTTYARRLYYGASSLFGVRDGFGIAVYDAVEDAHSIWAVQDDSASFPDASGTGADWLVDDVIVFAGKMFCAVRGHGAFFTEDSFKDVESGTAEFTTGTSGGTLTSSQYDGGTPGLIKMWRMVTVFADLPAAAQSFTLSYSVNGGTSYTALAATAGPSPADGAHVFKFNDLHSSRFQWKIVLKTTNEAVTPTLFAVVVAYLPQPEPNWMWSFVVPVSDKWELLDGTTEVKNTNTLITYLEGLFRSQALVEFTDVDGVVWATNGPGTIVYDITVVHYDIENPREADVRITLLESVESY